MQKHIISTNKAPQAIGTYSQAAPSDTSVTLT